MKHKTTTKIRLKEMGFVRSETFVFTLCGNGENWGEYNSGIEVINGEDNVYLGYSFSAFHRRS